MRDPARGKNFSVAELVHRGSTRGLVQKTLSDPDILAPNPHAAGGASMRLYVRARVETAEAGPEKATPGAGRRQMVDSGCDGPAR